MALTIFRRHKKECGKTSRRYRRCSCPIQVEGTLAGEKIRKSLDLTSWEAAEHVVHEWNRSGRIGVEGKTAISIEDATEKYLKDAGTRLKSSTVDLYRRGLSHLTTWCEKEKLKTVAELDIEKLRRIGRAGRAGR